MKLPEDRMPEAEVAIRLAWFFLETPGVSRALLNIDGAQVKVGKRRIFDVETFLKEHGWLKDGGSTHRRKWQGTYRRESRFITVGSGHLNGDVFVELPGQRRVFAECKKGPLVHKKGSQESPLLRVAIGQTLTSIDSLKPKDLLVVAVPDTKKFADLIETWSKMPRLKRTGIHFALVGRERVRGLESIFR